MHDNLYIFINKDINMSIIFLERLPRMGEIRVPPSLLNDHNCRVRVNICSTLTVMVTCPLEWGENPQTNTQTPY